MLFYTYIHVYICATQNILKHIPWLPKILSMWIMTMTEHSISHLVPINNSRGSPIHPHSFPLSLSLSLSLVDYANECFKWNLETCIPWLTWFGMIVFTSPIIPIGPFLSPPLLYWLRPPQFSNYQGFCVTQLNDLVNNNFLRNFFSQSLM